MQRALPGSLLVHAVVLGVALAGFTWPEADDAPAAEAVSVSIIAMSSVATNATELIESDATENLVSSGAVASVAPAVQPVQPQTVAAVSEPVSALSPEPQQPVVEPAEPRPLEPVEVETVVLTASASAIEPVSSVELKVAPVPQMLSQERTSRPTYPKPEAQQPRPQQPSQGGNGGANEADAVAAAGGAVQPASAGSGGDGAAARYPGDVLRKLRRVLRSTNGLSGEVVVRFTVLADGSVAGISIGRSSGNAAIDQAGLATVSRAAPFPPIPDGANRADWTFDVPLEFRG
jgi:periplasmic protein TonB